MRGIHRAEDLTRAPLLQLVSRPAVWAMWFERLKLPTKNAFQGLTFDSFAMASTAALAGLGVALLPTFFVEEELADGRLVAVARPQRTKDSYFLVVPEAKAASPHVSAFVRWVETSRQTRIGTGRRRRHILDLPEAG
jgi:LysR family glycine cleavage system transcriptional activator